VTGQDSQEKVACREGVVVMVVVVVHHHHHVWHQMVNRMGLPLVRVRVREEEEEKGMGVAMMSSSRQPAVMPCRSTGMGSLKRPVAGEQLPASLLSSGDRRVSQPGHFQVAICCHF
jgi:hypothetical protein